LRKNTARNEVSATTTAQDALHAIRLRSREVLIIPKTDRNRVF